MRRREEPARIGRRWFDPVLATVLLVICQVAVVSDSLGDHGHHHWPVAVNVVLVAGITVPLAWRRRAPLRSECVVMLCLVLLVAGGLADMQDLTFPQVALFIPTYSVAAYSSRRNALTGLLIFVVAVGAGLIALGSLASSFVFVIGAGSGSWIVGRAIRSRRSLATDLERTSEQITAEREGRQRLAVAEQRSRIATDLQTLVTVNVTEMIDQAQRAERWLADDERKADEAMEAVERTGRLVLGEMRRMLGVLRDDNHEVDLAPQPGIGQIPTLMEQARQHGLVGSLAVQGEPGPLPSSVDVGIYRIVEEAVHAVATTVHEPLDILIQFEPAGVELRLSGIGSGADWPNNAIREWVSLCGGQLHLEPAPDSRSRLVVRLPRVSGAAVA